MIASALCCDCCFLKAHLNSFDFRLTFLLTNLSNEYWICLNRSVTLAVALKEVKSWLNGSRMKFEFDHTFTWLPYNFSFVLKNVGFCWNHLNTSTNFCLTFAQHSFDWLAQWMLAKSQNCLNRPLDRMLHSTLFFFIHWKVYKALGTSKVLG